MIYTVTFNPSLDYFVTVDDFALGKTNRTTSERMVPSGKGINVSIVLRNFGYDSCALGFLAGFTGVELEKRLQQQGLTTDFIFLEDGETRINVKLQNYDGTEINGAGPSIDERHLSLLYKKLDALSMEDTLILSGSIPKALPQTTYRDLAKLAAERKARIVVDASGKLLEEVLPYRPFLIKPNAAELSEIFGVEIKSKEDAAYYGVKLKEKGAENVIVSLGGDGAVLIDANGNVHMRDVPQGKLVNAVGAGDSMLTGFLCGLMEQKSYEEAFKMAIAAGCSTAYTEGFTTRIAMEKLLKAL